MIQASTLTMFSAPPKAANTAGAFSAISPFPEVAAGCSLSFPFLAWKSAFVNNLVSPSFSSLPGVFKLNLVI